MRFGDTVDHDVHEGAVTDEVGRELMEIGGEDADMLLDDSAGRGVVFLRGVSGGNHVTIAQVKAGSSDENFPRLLGRTLILGVLQDADRGLFRTQERFLAERCRFCADWRSEHRRAGQYHEHQ